MWMKGFLFLGRWTIDHEQIHIVCGPLSIVKIGKEAQMKKRIEINYIFWKEGPLLFDLAQSKLPCLRTESNAGLDT